MIIISYTTVHVYTQDVMTFVVILVLLYNYNALVAIRRLLSRSVRFLRVFLPTRRDLTALRRGAASGRWTTIFPVAKT